MIIPFNPFPYSILKKAITHIKTGYAMHPSLAFKTPKPTLLK
jgi:hypothetical protein